MKEYLLEELPEGDVMQIELAISRWKNIYSKVYKKSKRLRIPIVDYRSVFEEDIDWAVWYVYDLETKKIYLEE